MANLPTITAVSAPRIRKLADKRAPVPAAEREERRQANAETQRQIDDAISEWRTATFAKADELADRFHKTPRYFLDQFFNGGAHMLQQQNKTNAFNAFKSIKAAAVNDGSGSATSLVELTYDYLDEYNALSDGEKQQYVDEFEENREVAKKVKRPTSRSRFQDVLNIMRIIIKLLNGLQLRVGIEAMVCIVRNTTNVYFAPQWYFTAPELAAYMPIATKHMWETSVVGAKMEAFAIAGCDPANMNTTAKQKADYLKKELRSTMKQMLVSVSGNPDATMNFVNYEEAVVLHYGVVLEGWTMPRFVNLSECSTALPPLEKLRKAMQDGSCFFRKLSPAELRKRKEDHEAKLVSGDVVRKPRKPRADKGKTRGSYKGKQKQVTEDEDDEDEAEPNGDTAVDDEESDGESVGNEGGGGDDDEPARDESHYIAGGSQELSGSSVPSHSSPPNSATIFDNPQPTSSHAMPAEATQNRQDSDGRMDSPRPLLPSSTTVNHPPAPADGSGTADPWAPSHTKRVPKRKVIIHLGHQDPAAKRRKTRKNTENIADAAET